MTKLTGNIEDYFVHPNLNYEMQEAHELNNIALESMEEIRKKIITRREELQICDLLDRIEKAYEDIKFCLESIKQEKEMSTDERTRKEMQTCVNIFKETLLSLKGEINE